MKLRRTRAQRCTIAGGILLLAAAWNWSGWLNSSAAAQSPALPKPLHGVVSQRKLSPPLNIPVRQVRFSPNGAFILVQDEAGIRVFAREPLSLRLVVAAPGALAAHFSADSKFVIAAGPALNTARYDLTFGSKVSDAPPFDAEGCLGSAISRYGELAACYNPDFRLTVFRTATREAIFSEVVNQPPPSRTPIPVPRGTDTAFAEPFGYFYSASMNGWIGRRDYGMTMTFSTDDRFLLAWRTTHDAVAADLTSRKKIAIPDSLKKRLNKPWCFAGPDRIAVLDPKKEGDSALFSFPEGQQQAQLPATGSGVSTLSQPRYLRIDSSGGEASRIFDLEANHFVNPLPKGPADIFQDTVAVYSSNGELSLYKLGENQPQENFTVPVNPLPTLRVAAVSPNLEELAIAVRGAGAVYRTGSGEQIASVPRMSGAWFAREESVFVRAHQPDGSPAPIQELGLKSGKVARAWSEKIPREKDWPREEVRSGGPVVLIVIPAGSAPVSVDGSRQEKPAADGSMPVTGGPVQQSTQAYELRAVSAENGKKLWARGFQRDVPVPFADPQGDRVVLAWAATSKAGMTEAGRIPNGGRRHRPSKISEQDTVFEVLDARTGKIVGGVIAQLGHGYESFEGAYSAGDSLILIKDSIRITIFSLSTGQEIARLRGAFSAASGQSNLLAASDGKRLALYDLKTGAKRDDFLFPEDVAYIHFSGDGKRFLVLTANQTVYVLETI